MSASRFDAFLEIQGTPLSILPSSSSSSTPTTSSSASPSGSPSPSPPLPRAPVLPTPPYFWGRPESQLTELERLQCDRYKRDLEEYNVYMREQEIHRMNLLAAKEAEIASLERELRLQAERARDSKLVVLYIPPNADKVYLNDQILRIRDLFASKGIHEIVMCDAAKHPELQELLKDEQFPIPLIMIRGEPVGDYKNLCRLEEYHKLDSLLDGSCRMSDIFIQNPDAPELQLGAVGSVLGLGENIISGVGSLLYMPVSLISWGFGSGTQPEPTPEGEEFTVVNTNWYGRELHRIYRLTDKVVERLHPTTREVRGSFPYEAITKVKRSDANNLVIFHSENGQEYIRCPATDIERILSLLVIHFPGELPIER